MKKALCILIALLMLCMAFVGCSNTPADTNDPAKTDGSGREGTSSDGKCGLSLQL